jgi:hypothetical protein
MLSDSNAATQKASTVTATFISDAKQTPGRGHPAFVV